MTEFIQFLNLAELWDLLKIVIPCFCAGYCMGIYHAIKPLDNK